MTAVVWVGVVLCGGLGAVARFALDGAVGRKVSSFPYGTLVVNVSGAFLLGLFEGTHPGSNLALVLGTGLLGAYTTFSTWMLETQRLVEERQHLRAGLNILGSVAAGIVAAGLGLWLGGGL